MGTGAHLKTLHEVIDALDIRSVAFSPDGRTLAGGTWNGIHLWDVRTGERLKTLTGHVDWINSLSFSPDGQMLASRGSREIYVWHVQTGKPHTVFTGYTSKITGVAFSPDGQTLVSGSWNGIHLWDVRTGERLKTLPTGHMTVVSDTGDTTTSYGFTVHSVAFSPDGQMLASGGFDNIVRLWDVGTGAHLKALTGHTGVAWSVAFSPDGQTLASGGLDGVRLWDVGTGAHLKTLTGHTGKVASVAFSPDGQTLASGGADKTVRVWDVGTGEPLEILTGHTHRVLGISFSSNGTLASSSDDGTIRLWDAHNGERPLGVPCKPMGPPVFSSDGGFLTVPDGFGRVLLIDLAVAEAWDPLGYPPDIPQVVAFSPDDTTVASGSQGGAILLWDVPPSTSQPDSQQPQRYSVRLVYFRPSDRTAQQEIDTKLGRLIKDVQHFYVTQMHRHGQKTFTFETGADGKPVVHHIDGKFTDAYYQQHTYDRVQKEIEEAFDIVKHVYLVAVDVSSETVESVTQGEVCGIGGRNWYKAPVGVSSKLDPGGLAVIPASGGCFTVGVTAHELGHVFGLEHDFRNETYLMGYGRHTKLSADAANWLSVHPYFNTGQTVFGQNTTLEVVSARASALRFQLTDTDGLHQVQLLIPTASGDPAPGTKLHSSKVLNGKTDRTVTFAVPELTNGSEVTLQVIDMQGHITKQTFSVETDSITEVPEVPVDGNVTRVRLSPASVWSGIIGDQLTVNVNIAEGVDVRGYQVELTFDTAALRFVSSVDAGYLPAGASQVPSVENGNRVTFGATSLQASGEGDGTLATFTFEVLAASPALPTLFDVKLTDSDANFIVVEIDTPGVPDSPHLTGDVNGDSVVNFEDMIVAVERLGQAGENTADINGDGVVDSEDLLLIVAEIAAAATAPSLHSSAVIEMFTATEVRQWLESAQAQGLTQGRYQRGILLLEQLLMILTPKETALLANYPNPFNPETWIPYQLSEPADVRISIYAVDGRLVRVLSLGHQGAGIYESRGHAAYWDGRNQLGEPVASGVYFYTFIAGEFTATRKMLIRK